MVSRGSTAASAAASARVCATSARSSSVTMRPACQALPVPSIPSSVGWIILTLVFADEILACVAAAVYGAHVGGWPVAAALVVLVVAAWWTFASPKAPLGGRVVRPLVKVL